MIDLEPARGEEKACLSHDAMGGLLQRGRGIF